MTIVNTNLQFESIDNQTYIKYLERAEMFHEKGLHLDLSVIQLAKQLYEKDVENESKSDPTNRS